MWNFLKKHKNSREPEVESIDKPFKKTKKNIHLFFRSIRNHENERVKAIVTENKDFVFVTRPDLPKKDNGQTGLQVSFKVGNFEVAEFLINENADVNFIDKSEENEWNMPVLHDCIRATIFQTNTMRKNTERFDIAFGIMTLMLSKGANPNGIDSYGNSCLMRALMDSDQMIDHPNFDENSETIDQLRKVFSLLIENGADINYFNEKRPRLKESIKTFGLEKYSLV